MHIKRYTIVSFLFITFIGWYITTFISTQTISVNLLGIEIAPLSVSIWAMALLFVFYIASVIHGGSHAGYYPGALSSTLKICFDPKSGKMYGAQIVGFDGVDKRIDIIATAMNFSASIYDLQEIEHAYAPPFSSAKDIVNQAGFTAENIITGKTKIKSWKDYQNIDLDKNFLLDVRTPSEYELGHIKGSKNIELDSLRANLNLLLKDKNILIYYCKKECLSTILEAKFLITVLL